MPLLQMSDIESVTVTHQQQPNCRLAEYQLAGREETENEVGLKKRKGKRCHPDRTLIPPGESVVPSLIRPAATLNFYLA